MNDMSERTLGYVCQLSLFSVQHTQLRFDEGLFRLKSERVKQQPTITSHGDWINRNSKFLLLETQYNNVYYPLCLLINIWSGKSQLRAKEKGARKKSTVADPADLPAQVPSSSGSIRPVLLLPFLGKGSPGHGNAHGSGRAVMIITRLPV